MFCVAYLFKIVFPLTGKPRHPNSIHLPLSESLARKTRFKHLLILKEQEVNRKEQKSKLNGTPDILDTCVHLHYRFDRSKEVVNHNNVAFSQNMLQFMAIFCCPTLVSLQTSDGLVRSIYLSSPILKKLSALPASFPSTRYNVKTQLIFSMIQARYVLHQLCLTPV